MFSRPSFCCSCGEKIERIEWHVWTSRRFCELCQTENQFEEWFPRLLCTLCVLLGISGIGGLAAGANSTPDLRHSPVEMAIERGRRLPRQTSIPEVSERPDRLPEMEAPTADSPGRTGNRPGIENEPIVVESEYFCGAETKKGGPCSRKVKGPVRCWQHEGREPIVPQNELLVK